MDKEGSGGKYVERERRKRNKKSKEQVRKCFCKGITNDRR